MKKLLLISGVLLAFTATSAMAAGQLHLSFTDCGGVGLQTAPSNCSNTGSIVLVASAVSGVDIPLLAGYEGIVDMAQAGSTLSQWWHFEAGGCRSGKLVASADFTAGASCVDFWGGQYSATVFVLTPGGGTGLSPANSRFDVYGAASCGCGADYNGTDEIAVFKLSILRSGTVGGPCGGCSDPTSFYFNDLVLAQPTGTGANSDLSGDGTNQGCGYAGGNVPTPTKNTSWGSIKALYR